MNVYVIQYQAGPSKMPVVSTLAFRTLEKAQWFIQHRSGQPVMVSPFIFQTEAGETYTIVEVAVRKDGRTYTPVSQL